jgi:hypothetical protein
MIAILAINEWAVSVADSHNPACTTSSVKILFSGNFELTTESTKIGAKFLQISLSCMSKRAERVPTPRRLDRSVKCFASSSATLAQSRKNSTGSRSPLISKSANRAMISHARSIAYCSIFARASRRQREDVQHNQDISLRSIKIRDFSVAPFPLSTDQHLIQCYRLLGHTSWALYPARPYPPL